MIDMDNDGYICGHFEELLVVLCKLGYMLREGIAKRIRGEIMETSD